MSDVVEREITISAPVDRVWNALTDVGQFNDWFGVELRQPFAPGATSTGKISPKNLPQNARFPDMTIQIEQMEAPRLFSYRWHPFAIDPDKDYSHEPTTLVEFRLDAIDGGTRLTVRESGFESLPPDRIEPAWRSNDRGWQIQADRIKAYVEG